MTRFIKSVARGVVLVLLSVLLLAIPGGNGVDAAYVSTPVGVTLSGLDAHDGTIVEDGDTLYLVGTRYGCGFQWGQSNTPFCGFGLWSSSNGISGPWTSLGNLFNPTGTNTERGESWQATCGATGTGCFNPRLAKRWDGLWLLYFNAPGDVSRTPTRSNAYYVMGCNSLAAGACGSAAGAPHGSTRAMPMGACNVANGDFSVAVDGTTIYLVCTMFNATITIERLDYWWTTGEATASSGAVRSIAYLTAVEAPGLYKDPGSGMWVLTYSDPICGYCAGTGTSYAVSQVSLADTSPSTTPLGTWLAPGNTGWSAPASGRREVSGTSCGGQPRTALRVGSQVWEWIDLWAGPIGGTQANQTNAGIRLEPLIRTGAAWRGAADGTSWPGAFQPFVCQ